MHYNKEKVEREIRRLMSEGGIDLNDIDIDIGYPAGAVAKWLDGYRDSEMTDRLGEYLANEQGIEFGGVSANNRGKGTSVKRKRMIKIVAAVVALCVIAVAVKLAYHTVIVKKDIIAIAEPADKSTIAPNKIMLTGDNQISIQVKVVAGDIEKIPQDEYLTCFARVFSGDEYYVTGVPAVMTEEEQFIDYVTLGGLNDDTGSYEIQVAILKEKLASGQRISAIPPTKLKSKRIRVNIDKASIRKLNGR
jgi:hypothetical protein